MAAWTPAEPCGGSPRFRAGARRARPAAAVGVPRGVRRDDCGPRAARQGLQGRETSVGMWGPHSEAGRVSGRDAALGARGVHEPRVRHVSGCPERPLAAERPRPSRSQPRPSPRPRPRRDRPSASGPAPRLCRAPPDFRPGLPEFALPSPRRLRQCGSRCAGESRPGLPLPPRPGQGSGRTPRAQVRGRRGAGRGGAVSGSAGARGGRAGPSGAVAEPAAWPALKVVGVGPPLRPLPRQPADRVCEERRRRRSGSAGRGEPRGPGRGRATVVWGLTRRRPALTLAQLRGETRGEAPSLIRGKPGRGEVPVALLGPVGPVLPVPGPDGGSEGRTNPAQPTPVAGGAPALCPAQPHSLESGGPPGPGASPCRGPSLSGAHVPTATPIQVLPAVTSFTPVLEKQPTGVQRDGLTLSSCGGWKIQNL